MMRTRYLLAALVLVGASASFAADAGVQVWLTTADHRLALTAGAAPGAAAADAAEPVRIEIDAEQRHQSMLGFGAALTDASAWLIQNKLDDTQRAALMQELFGREPGIGLSFARLTIGASDFSRHHYSLDDMPAGKRDPKLARFSIEPNRGDVLPVARAALAINPELKLMASPWSAPAWMKDSDSLITGTLRKRHFDDFARYLLKYVDAYAAEGVPIFALTVQNEPDFEPANYPGMRLSAKQRAQLIGRHLGPMLKARGGTPLIFEWDHNWDKPYEPMQVLADRRAARHVAGIAWHCYGGNISAQSKVHDAFPDKDVYLTECSGGNWEPVISGGLIHVARELIIDATRHWARGILFWNLALDENRGPHTGGCGTCRGLVTIHSQTGTIERTDDYYALAHASRFVRRNAQRITSNVAAAGIANVAFRNADDGSRVLIVTNSEASTQRIRVLEHDVTFDYELPPRSLATFVWPENAVVTR